MNDKNDKSLVMSGDYSRVAAESSTDNYSTLSHAELLSKLRLCDSARFTDLTKDEKAEALRLRIYTIAMTSTNEATIIKAANDWLDREEGTPVQSMRMAAVVKSEKLGEDDAEILARFFAGQQKTKQLE